MPPVSIRRASRRMLRSGALRQRSTRQAALASGWAPSPTAGTAIGPVRQVVSALGECAPVTLGRAKSEAPRVAFDADGMVETNEGLQTSPRRSRIRARRRPRDRRSPRTSPSRRSRPAGRCPTREETLGPAHACEPASPGASRMVCSLPPVTVNVPFALPRPAPLCQRLRRLSPPRLALVRASGASPARHTHSQPRRTEQRSCLMSLIRSGSVARERALSKSAVAPVVSPPSALAAPRTA